MLSSSLSPDQQLQQGYFLPWLLAGLAWRQSPGSGELGGWRGHRCHLPLNLPHPTDADRHLGTQHWKHCHGVLHWQKRITEMFRAEQQLDDFVISHQMVVNKVSCDPTNDPAAAGICSSFSFIGMKTEYCFSSLSWAVKDAGISGLTWDVAPTTCF